MSPFQSIRNWYGRYERPLSSLSLILGFVFDAVTLRRVDTLWENFWIIAHLLVVGIFIFLIHLKENEGEDEKDPGKAHFWYVNILQFFFGGILSTYLVFYFRSSDILVTWPFMLVLVLAFIANESLKRHYVRLSFQISLFFLSVYSFMIFLVPIVLHKIGALVFILSGVLSLVFTVAFTLGLLYLIKNKFAKEEYESKKLIFSLIGGIFLIVNFLYFTNLIPPIPLSLKDAGVYHSIQKTSDGNYAVTYEDHGWEKYFSLYDDFTKVPGEPVYAYSAIFSPGGLNLTVYHQWQHYDEKAEAWATRGTIHLSVIGGREGGYRTYSYSSNPEPGLWRVNIKTEAGQTIGRLRFNVTAGDTEPVLSDTIKY